MLCYSTVQHLVDWRINVAEKVSQVASSLLQFFSFHNVLFSFFFKILSTVVFVFTKKMQYRKNFCSVWQVTRIILKPFIFFRKILTFWKIFPGKLSGIISGRFLDLRSDIIFGFLHGCCFSTSWPTEQFWLSVKLKTKLKKSKKQVISK